MYCQTFRLLELKNYKYVVILSKHKGQWVFCKHKNRTTLENAGGHIEPGETPLEAAKRELYEETGAKCYDIKALFDYSAGDDKSSANGVVFYADIFEFEDIPESEMESRHFYDDLPTNFTYPEITKELFDMLRKDYKDLYYT